MSIQRLGYMGFEVADVPAWRSFVTSKLGAMEASANEAEATFRIDSRTWRLSVSKGTADDYLLDRKSVVEGKWWAVRGDLGGRRLIKKTKTKQLTRAIRNK